MASLVGYLESAHGFTLRPYSTKHFMQRATGPVIVEG